MTRARSDAGGIRMNASGSYRVLYTAPDGQRLSAGSYATEKQAKARLREVLTDIGRGDWMDESKAETLFSEVASKVFDLRTDWSAGTRRNNDTHLRNALLEFMGKPMKAITVETVDRWWASRSVAPVNRRNAYFLLTTIMNYAERWHYVRNSPCKIPKAGKDVAKPRPRFTVQQLASVIRLMPEHMQTACWVAFSAHLRLGEIVGLDRRDFDAPTGLLTVERQWSTVGGTHEATTKTGSVRALKLLKPGLELLREHVVDHPMLPNAPMFTGVKGARLAQGVLRAAWNAARDEAGLPDLHIHDTKRVSLTHFAKTGASIKEFMARSGHTSVTTAARYLDASPERDAELAAIADRLLDGTGF